MKLFSRHCSHDWGAAVTAAQDQGTQQFSVVGDSFTRGRVDEEGVFSISIGSLGQ